MALQYDQFIYSSSVIVLSWEAEPIPALRGICALTVIHYGQFRVISSTIHTCLWMI